MHSGSIFQDKSYTILALKIYSPPTSRLGCVVWLMISSVHTDMAPSSSRRTDCCCGDGGALAACSLVMTDSARGCVDTPQLFQGNSSGSPTGYPHDVNALKCRLQIRLRRSSLKVSTTFSFSLAPERKRKRN